MRGKDCPHRGIRHRLITAGTRAALIAALASTALPLQGAATGRAATRPATTSAPATTRGTPASSTASAPATRPALQADAILSKFPGNANVLAARSDARNFTIEGRVRDVRTVTLDPPAGAAAASGAAPKTELRVALVGRSQADDLPAHFACRFDNTTVDAAAKLQPDQIIRLTGAIGPAVAAADRIDLLNCHDFSVTGPLNLGDQLAGVWRCNDLQVDGAALRKSNQARGIKADDVPDANYSPSWHLDLGFKADGTLAAELADNAGPILKKLTGRFLIVKDAPAETRLRLDVQGAASQEITASLEAGRLKLTLPGLADKFVLPDSRFGKLEGTQRPVDYQALKAQTMQWLAANINPASVNNVSTFVSNTLNAGAAAHQGFALNLGAGVLRRGRTTILLGACGKLMPLEFSDAETQANAATRMNVNGGLLPNWGNVMVPEVKIDALSVDNRAAFDASKPLTGKITLRGLRRMPDAQYFLIAYPVPSVMNIEKPGPDPQTIAFRFDPVPTLPGNPRPMFFFVGRQAQPGDLFGDNANRLISDPMPVLLDIAPPR